MPLTLIALSKVDDKDAGLASSLVNTGSIVACPPARSPQGHQTRYAAVGYHHGPQVIQPTR